MITRFDCSGQALPIDWELRVRLEDGRHSRDFVLLHTARLIAKTPFLYGRSDVAKAHGLLLAACEDGLAAQCIKVAA